MLGRPSRCALFHPWISAWVSLTASAIYVSISVMGCVLRCVLSVRRLCACWQSAIDTVTARQLTLQSMLSDSRQFEQLYTDTDKWIVQTSQSHSVHSDIIGSDLATIKQHKDIVEVFRRDSEIVFCKPLSRF